MDFVGVAVSLLRGEEGVRGASSQIGRMKTFVGTLEAEEHICSLYESENTVELMVDHQDEH